MFYYVKGGTSFVDHLCYLCPVLFMLSRLFVAALWSPAGKGLNSWLLFVIFNYVFVTSARGILGQVWCVIVSIPDLCPLSYFVHLPNMTLLTPVLEHIKMCPPPNPKLSSDALSLMVEQKTGKKSLI